MLKLLAVTSLVQWVKRERKIAFLVNKKGFHQEKKTGMENKERKKTERLKNK